MKSTGLALCLLVATAAGLGAQEEDFQVQPEAPTAPARKRPGIFRFHPAKRTPAEQLAHAQALDADGAWRRSGRAYNALVHAWHDAPEAAAAQEGFAVELEKQGSYEKAFQEYQYLIDHFTGHIDFDAVVERQFAIANLLAHRRRGAILFFKGISSRSTARPLLEQVARNAPDGPHAAEARFLVGTIHEQEGEFEEAVVAYGQVQFSLAGNPFAATAAYQRTVCLAELSRRAPRDEMALREALAALAAFVRDYRNDPNADAAERQLEALKDRLAAMYYERAVFYDRLAHQPAAALIAYRDFVKRFPVSRQAILAGARIDTLETLLGEDVAP